MNYTSIYIFFTPILLFQDNFKNAKMMKIQQLHQEIHAKQLFIILFKLFSIGDSYKFNANQETRQIQSRANVIHVRTQKNSL